MTIASGHSEPVDFAQIEPNRLGTQAGVYLENWEREEAAAVLARRQQRKSNSKYESDGNLMCCRSLWESDDDTDSWLSDSEDAISDPEPEPNFLFDSATGSCPAEMKAELVSQEGPLQTFASSSSSDELSQQKTV
ncbi:unnamed protein product, partial [Protopolystoma xenopodis]